MSKKYSIEISNEAELLKATDSAFIICGLLNSLCFPQNAERNASVPHDPVYNIVSANCQKKKIPSAVLFSPAVGCYYSTRLFKIQVVCRQEVYAYAMNVWHLLMYC